MAPASTYTVQTTDPTSDDGGSGTSSQTIQLQQGWNLVAARVAPSNTELETVLSDVMDHILLVKDENGKIYSPSDDVNEIGAWDVKESYLIYADADVAFAIEGQSVDASSTPLALSAEWNLVPFYGTSALSVEDAVAPIADDILLVKDDQGNIYYPESGVNSIGDMLPGRGYKMYLKNEATLTYPSSVN